MRSYTVHLKDDAPLDGSGLVFVKEGFSFFAFLVPALWFLLRAMWIPLGLYLALTVLIGLAAEEIGLGSAPGLVMALVIALLVGYEANDIYRWSLAERGYVMAAVVAAPSLTAAETEFLRLHRAGEDAAAANPPSRSGTPMPAEAAPLPSGS